LNTIFDITKEVSENDVHRRHSGRKGWELKSFDKREMRGTKVELPPVNYGVQNYLNRRRILLAPATLGPFLLFSDHDGLVVFCFRGKGDRTSPEIIQDS
jgi:hypothetical protein